MYSESAEDAISPNAARRKPRRSSARQPYIGPHTPESIGAGQADHWDDTIGLLLVGGVARLDLGDLLPRLSACLSIELGRSHPHLLAAELDPDLVWVGSDVVVPSRVMYRSAGRGNHQPGILPVWKSCHRGLPLLTSFGSHRGQVQQIHPLKSIARAPMPAGH